MVEFHVAPGSANQNYIIYILIKPCNARNAPASIFISYYQIPTDDNAAYISIVEEDHIISKNGRKMQVTNF